MSVLQGDSKASASIGKALGSLSVVQKSFFGENNALCRDTYYNYRKCIDPHRHTSTTHNLLIKNKGDKENEY